MTVKRSREDTEVETLAMANSLMLLSRMGPTSTSGRMFECKTCKLCNRKFQTFQALGGHRASHKKPKLIALDLLNDSPVKPKTHECSICGLEFPIGQALGGHMRRHRAAVSDGSVGSTEAVPVTKKLDKEGALCFDLNLTPYENDLKFRFGKVFPLVEC